MSRVVCWHQRGKTQIALWEEEINRLSVLAFLLVLVTQPNRISYFELTHLFILE